MITSYGFTQDLTGTWEGEFTSGTIGLRQTSRMQLELVEVEGRLYGIFRLFPIDTKKDDQPNVIYTVEGDRGKKGDLKFAIYKGRIVESNVPEQAKEFFQFTTNYKNDKEETLSGKWFYELEPLDSKERGAGTFNAKKVSNNVSDLLKGRKKEKEILEKIEKG
jgi:hypothetical protein